MSARSRVDQRVPERRHELRDHLGYHGLLLPRRPAARAPHAVSDDRDDRQLPGVVHAGECVRPARWPPAGGAASRWRARSRVRSGSPAPSPVPPAWRCAGCARTTRRTGGRRRCRRQVLSALDLRAYSCVRSSITATAAAASSTSSTRMGPWPASSLSNSWSAGRAHDRQATERVRHRRPDEGKMPGEPTRVQPSRAKKPASEDA